MNIEGRGAMRLTEQQREILELAEIFDYLTARMFVGLPKPPSGSRHPYTMSSAQAAMRRLAKRGLLRQDPVNPAIFRRTPASAEAIL